MEGQPERMSTRQRAGLGINNGAINNISWENAPFYYIENRVLYLETIRLHMIFKEFDGLLLA